MEGLVVMLCLLVGAVVATGVSMAGLRLITSFVGGPETRRQATQLPEEPSTGPHPAAH